MAQGLKVLRVFGSCTQAGWLASTRKLGFEHSLLPVRVLTYTNIKIYTLKISSGNP